MGILSAFFRLFRGCMGDIEMGKNLEKEKSGIRRIIRWQVAIEHAENILYCNIEMCCCFCWCTRIYGSGALQNGTHNGSNAINIISHVFVCAQSQPNMFSFIFVFSRHFHLFYQWMLHHWNIQCNIFSCVLWRYTFFD